MGPAQCQCCLKDLLPAVGKEGVVPESGLCGHLVENLRSLPSGSQPQVRKQHLSAACKRGSLPQRLQVQAACGLLVIPRAMAHPPGGNLGQGGGHLGTGHLGPEGSPCFFLALLGGLVNRERCGEALPVGRGAGPDVPPGRRAWRRLGSRRAGCRFVSTQSAEAAQPGCTGLTFPATAP